MRHDHHGMLERDFSPDHRRLGGRLDIAGQQQADRADPYGQNARGIVALEACSRPRVQQSKFDAINLPDLSGFASLHQTVRHWQRFTCKGPADLKGRINIPYSAGVIEVGVRHQQRMQAGYPTAAQIRLDD